MKTITKGTKVYWNDPENISSGLCKILNDFTIADNDNDTPILIGNTSSETEVFLNELDFEFMERQARAVQTKIRELKDEYNNKHNCDPEYAECKIMFLDDTNECDVKVKLSADLDEDDDNIFYYFNSVNDLRFYTLEGCNEFIITDIYELI